MKRVVMLPILLSARCPVPESRRFPLPDARFLLLLLTAGEARTLPRRATPPAPHAAYTHSAASLRAPRPAPPAAHRRTPPPARRGRSRRRDIRRPPRRNPRRLP